MAYNDWFCSFRQEIRAEGVGPGWCSQGGRADTVMQTQQESGDCCCHALVPSWLSYLVQDMSFSGPQVLYLPQGCALPTPPITQAIVRMK